MIQSRRKLCSFACNGAAVCYEYCECMDEVQYAVPKSIINVKTFDNDDAAKEFKLENPDYSSDVGHSTKGKSYLTKANILTQTIDKSIESTVKHLKLRVDLGYAWASGMNWCQTH